MKPTPTPDVIERIAKIIDKSAWQAIEDGRDALPHSLWGIRRDGARHTAAEVIAALSVPAEAVVGEPDGWKLVPIEPTDDLLRSMAIRSDHGLGVPGFYDQPSLGGKHARRMEVTMSYMRQLYEEVVGNGFHRAAPSAPDGVDEQALDKAAREGYAVRCKTHGPRVLDQYASADIMLMQLDDARVIVSAYLAALGGEKP